MDSKATRISPTMDNFCQNFKLQFRTKSTKIYQEILQKYRPLSVQLRKYSLYMLKHLDGNFLAVWFPTPYIRIVIGYDDIFDTHMYYIKSAFSTVLILCELVWSFF